MELKPLLKPKSIKLRTTRIINEVWDKETEEYIEVSLLSSTVIAKLENKLTEARRCIAEAAKLAAEHKIEFRPLGDIFTSDEIESQGWSSSNC